MDLGDCLLIQLRRLGKENTLEYQIISKHLDELGKRRFPEIARRLGVTSIRCSRQRIRLRPLTRNRVPSSRPIRIIMSLPDVSVEKIGDNYTVMLNGEQIPHLRISNTYKDLMAQNGSGGDVKDYIREKIRSGKFLIKSIHQRQQTISNIANQIVGRQQEFLDHGTAFLRPMTMVQIAEAVGVHETTVSRAISGKYMSTPQGVFEMRYFFHPRLPDGHGRVDEQHQRERSHPRPHQKRERPQSSQRQGYRLHPQRARHPHRPPYRGQVS